MEEMKVSCALTNKFIAELLKEKIDSLGEEIKYLSYWQNADIVIVDDEYLLNNLPEIQKLIEEEKILVLLDYELSDDDIAVFLKLFPIKGVIYKDMEPKLLKKLFYAVKAGEVWIKRSIFHYILKDDFAVRNFSMKELKIIHYLLKGYTNKEIAKELGLTEQSIKYYINHLLKKVKCENRTQLIIKFLKFKKLIQALINQGELVECLNS